MVAAGATPSGKSPADLANIITSGSIGKKSLILPTMPTIILEPINGKLVIKITQPATEIAIKHYNIYYSRSKPSNLSNMTFVTSITGNSYTLSGLTNNSTYYVAVQPVSIEGYENASIWEIVNGVPTDFQRNTTVNSSYSGARIATVSSFNLEDFINFHGISSGTFTGLSLGDRIIFNDGSGLNSIEYAIAGADTQSDLIAAKKHHLTLIAINSYGMYPMNTSNTNSGGYKGCYLRTSGYLVTITNRLSNLFGSHLLEHRIKERAGTYTEKVSLMSVFNCYGADSWYNWGDRGDPEEIKFPIFDHVDHKSLYGSGSRGPWLRSTLNNDSFAFISEDRPSYYNASIYMYVYPFITIG